MTNIKRFLMILATCLSASRIKAAENPNIILVFTDDQGWADTSVMMHPDREDSRKGIYHTPNLERMAAEGLIFSQAYAGAPQCAPSRGALQFGMTPTRLGHTTNAGDKLVGDRSHLLTIPQAIRKVKPGYAAAHLGKWHIPGHLPDKAGFEVNDGNTGNQGGEYYYRESGKVKLPPEDPKQIFTVSERACKFIAEQAQAKKPFYLQISHYATHVSLQSRPETYEKTKARLKEVYPEAAKKTIKFAAMVEDLDSGLGMVLDEVEKQGIKDNTYVIFTSDNGGFQQTKIKSRANLKSANHPLTGGKRWTYEGGIRVPFVVTGPRVPKGKYCNQPIVNWDFLPTFYELVGGTEPLSKDLGLDGGSFKCYLEGNDSALVQRGTSDLIWRFLKWEGTKTDAVHPSACIRRGKYKLYYSYYSRRYELFDVESDIEENIDLISSMPERAEELKKAMLQYFEDVDAQDYWIHRKDGKGNLIGTQGLEEEVQLRQREDEIKRRKNSSKSSK